MSLVDPSRTRSHQQRITRNISLCPVHPAVASRRSAQSCSRAPQTVVPALVPPSRSHSSRRSEGV